MTKDPVSQKKQVEAGERLRNLRKKLHLQQSDLAEIVKKGVRTVARWESGKASPSQGDWTLMAARLQVMPAWLISGEGSPDIDAAFRKIESSISPDGSTISLYPVADVNGSLPSSFSSGSTSKLPVYEECCSEEDMVDWRMVIQAYDEIRAYIEMSEEYNGRTPDELSGNLPRATMAMYHHLQAHAGRTPDWREMNDIIREIRRG